MKPNFIRLFLTLLLAASSFAQTASAPKPIDLLKQKLEQIGAGVSADVVALRFRPTT